VYRGEPGFGGGGHELRPARLLGVKGRDRDRLTGNVAIQARAFVGLKLKQLEVAGILQMLRP